MKTLIPLGAAIAGLVWIASTPGFEHGKHSARLIAIGVVVGVPFVVWVWLHRKPRQQNSRQRSYYPTQQGRRR